MNFFMFTSVLLDGILDGLSKCRLFIVENLHSIRLALPKHTRKRFHRWLAAHKRKCLKVEYLDRFECTSTISLTQELHLYDYDVAH
jgi:hypothetical protein